ncbi:hypothetical protein HDU79_000526 [Rhizoclosmatium sp. JEL0117]|nr:hypothetical protein HDU79_000526 [Rhizoclosmatium sp. JEL0117]
MLSTHHHHQLESDTNTQQQLTSLRAQTTRLDRRASLLNDELCAAERRLVDSDRDLKRVNAELKAAKKALLDRDDSIIQLEQLLAEMSEPKLVKQSNALPRNSNTQNLDDQRALRNANNTILTLSNLLQEAESARLMLDTENSALRREVDHLHSLVHSLQEQIEGYRELESNSLIDLDASAILPIHSTPPKSSKRMSKHSSPSCSTTDLTAEPILQSLAEDESFFVEYYSMDSMAVEDNPLLRSCASTVPGSRVLSPVTTLLDPILEHEDDDNDKVEFLSSMVTKTPYSSPVRTGIRIPTAQPSLPHRHYSFLHSLGLGLIYEDIPLLPSGNTNISGKNESILVDKTVESVDGVDLVDRRVMNQIQEMNRGRGFMMAGENGLLGRLVAVACKMILGQ